MTDSAYYMYLDRLDPTITRIVPTDDDDDDLFDTNDEKDE